MPIIKPPCDITLLQNEVDTLITNSYSICNAALPTEIDPNTLKIIETGSWCAWQPTYTVTTPNGAPIGLDPTNPGTIQITTLITNNVYNQVMNEFNNWARNFTGTAAGTYATNSSVQSAIEASASRIEGVYAQFQDDVTAQVAAVQTATTNQTSALSSAITTTQAQFRDEMTATTAFYQQSYASATEALAQVGATAWVIDPITGKSALSGFKASADTNKGSEFIVFADTFKIATGVESPDGTHITAMSTPFKVENGTVYVGDVDTSTPQITYIGEYATAPTSYNGAPLRNNMTYKNTINYNMYIVENGAWVLYVEAVVSYKTTSSPSVIQVSNTNLPSFPNCFVSATITTGTAASDANVRYLISSDAAGDIPYYYPASPGLTQNSVSIPVTAMIANGAKLITVDVYSDANATNKVDTITIPITKDGANSTVVSLSNGAHTFSANASGYISDYAGSGTTITAFYGYNSIPIHLTRAAALAGLRQGSLPQAYCLSTETVANGISVGGFSKVGDSIVVDRHSNMTSNTATITYKIHVLFFGGTETEQTQVQTLSKSLQGSQGTRGAASLGIAGIDRGALTTSQYAAWYAYNEFSARLGAPQFFDSITTSNTNASNGWTATFYYDGNVWAEQALVVNGNAIVSGTLSAAKIRSDSLSSHFAVSNTLYFGNSYPVSVSLKAQQKGYYVISAYLDAPASSSSKSCIVSWDAGGSGFSFTGMPSGTAHISSGGVVAVFTVVNNNADEASFFFNVRVTKDLYDGTASGVSWSAGGSFHVI